MNHFVRNSPFDRIYRWRAGFHRFGFYLGPAVSRTSRSVKDPPEKGISERHFERVADEPNLVSGGDSFGAGKYLETDLVILETDNLGQLRAVSCRDDGKLVVPYSPGLDRHDVAGYL